MSVKLPLTIFWSIKPYITENIQKYLYIIILIVTTQSAIVE